LLLVASKDDSNVPAASTGVLYKAATVKDKRLVVVPGRSHGVSIVDDRSATGSTPTPPSTALAAPARAAPAPAAPRRRRIAARRLPISRNSAAETLRRKPLKDIQSRADTGSQYAGRR
jgi:hypothetical protein